MSNKSKNLVTLVTTHVGRQGSVDLSAVPGSNPKQLIYAYLKFNLTHTFCNFSLSFSVNCENELKIEKKIGQGCTKVNKTQICHPIAQKISTATLAKAGNINLYSQNFQGTLERLVRNYIHTYSERERILLLPC